MSCNICFKISDKLNNIKDTDPGNVSLLAKIRYVVPEMEWFDCYAICDGCKLDTERCYDFKTLCVQMGHKRLPDFYSDDSSDKLVDNSDKIVDISDKLSCKACLQQFDSEKQLDNHVENAHSIVDKNGKKRQFSVFQCEVCNVNFKMKKLLVEHCLNEHSINARDIKPYLCYKCPKRFRTCTNLIQHKKHHQGARAHVCSVCGKAYITHSDLAAHEQIHLNKRAYGCQTCNSAFNTSKTLKAHIFVVHTDSKNWKYGCEVCGKKFPLKVGFDEHRKRHAGVKTFICHICEKAFVSKAELVKHTRHHSIVKQ